MNPLTPMHITSNSAAKSCFVVSPIGAEGSKIRERANKVLKHVIEPVCKDLGFEPIRADQMALPSLISKEVMRKVLTADLVIADLSGANPNVYYELATRHFVGKPAVQIIDKKERIPFDLADLNTIHLDLTDPDSLVEAKAKLSAFIQSGMISGLHENPISNVLTEMGVAIQNLPGNPKAQKSQRLQTSYLLSATTPIASRSTSSALPSTVRTKS